MSLRCCGQTFTQQPSCPRPTPGPPPRPSHPRSSRPHPQLCQAVTASPWDHGCLLGVSACPRPSPRQGVTETSSSPVKPCKVPPCFTINSKMALKTSAPPSPPPTPVPRCRSLLCSRHARGSLNRPHRKPRRLAWPSVTRQAALPPRLRPAWPHLEHPSVLGHGYRA